MTRELGDHRSCSQVDRALIACRLAAFTAEDYAWLAVVAASLAIASGPTVAEIAATMKREVIDAAKGKT